MGAALRLTAGLRPLKNLRYHAPDGTVHAIKSGKVRTAAGLKPFFGSFSTSLSTDEVLGFSYGKPNATVESSGVGVTAAGGNSPFTYAWARTDGGPHTITATDSTKRLTGFKATVPAAQSYTATFACTVTDASGQAITTTDVAVTLTNESLS
jgi:hypothetical protein